MKDNVNVREQGYLWRCRESTNTHFREGLTGSSITLQHGITTQHLRRMRSRSTLLGCNRS